MGVAATMKRKKRELRNEALFLAEGEVPSRIIK